MNEDILEYINKNESKISGKNNEDNIIFLSEEFHSDYETVKKIYMSWKREYIKPNAVGKVSNIEPEVKGKWNAEEVEFLKNNYSKMKTSEIAERLNRNEASIISKAYNIGVKKEWDRPSWSEEDVEKLLRFKKEGKTYSEIAKILKNRTKKSCSLKYRSLKNGKKRREKKC